MLNKEKLALSYPRYVLIAYLNWLLYANTPFLGILRKYFIIFTVLLTIPLIFDQNNILDCIKSNIPFIIFFAVCIISTLITRTILTPVLWTTLLVTFAAYKFVNIADKNEVDKLINAAYISLNIVIIASLIGILLVKFTNLEETGPYIVKYSLGNFIQGNRFFGILNSCNNLGPIAAISAIIAISRLLNARKQFNQIILNIIMFTVDIYVLLGTKCMTSMISLLGSFVILFICCFNKKRGHVLLITLGVCILGLILVICNIDFASSILHKNLKTATGRTEIWANSIKLIKQHPIVGYGSTVRYHEAAQINNLYINKAGTHNMYLEIALLYGIPSLVMYIISIIFTIYKILKKYLSGAAIKENHLLTPILIIGFCFILGLAEKLPLFVNNPIMIIFLVSFISIDKIFTTTTRD